MNKNFVRIQVNFKKGKIMKSIILGGGCFWCIEAVFKNIKGIISTEVGYSGASENATYESVCNGDGNVEVLKLDYDEKLITLEELLKLFFIAHDPTSLNKQGADVGVQYASVIFYEDERDEPKIKDFIQNASKAYQKPILTRVEKITSYTRAEEYHQDFFTKNPYQAYCQAVIVPKINTISIELKSLLK